MAAYTVNERAVARAQRLIDARQYVLDSEWGEVQPSAADENAFPARHSWEEQAPQGRRARGPRPAPAPRCQERLIEPVSLRRR